MSSNGVFIVTGWVNESCLFFVLFDLKTLVKEIQLWVFLKLIPSLDEAGEDT